MLHVFLVNLFDLNSVFFLQTTGHISETLLLLLHLSALPPSQTLSWRSTGRATSQRSLLVSFMDLPQLVKPLTHFITSIVPNSLNILLEMTRATCCRPQSSILWLVEELLRSSLAQGAFCLLRDKPATLKSPRWCTGPSSTPGSTRTRSKLGTMIKWIHLVDGPRWATYPLVPLGKTEKFQSWKVFTQEVFPKTVHLGLATKKELAPWGGWDPCHVVCWTCSCLSLCPSQILTWCLCPQCRWGFTGIVLPTVIHLLHISTQL